MRNASLLPPGWRWAKLGEVAEINPRRPKGFQRDSRAPTTFVPMAAVDARRGEIADPQIRPYAEVANGFTFFAEGDVLFAKITPCMQNGKHAVATRLIHGLGFASTEFHVLRAGPQIEASWIHHFLRQSSVLEAATKHFTGAVGQQRVPDDFLRNLLVPLPPPSEQRRIAAMLVLGLNELRKARAAAEARLAAANGLPAAYLRSIFDGKRAANWKPRPLGLLLKARHEVMHPRDKPSGAAVFVGLEHIESGTGRRFASVSLRMEDLKGRKPRFYKGDIVYGYLRPYLNKVWVAEFDGLCSVDQYIFTVQPKEANAEFIAWFMRSPVYLERAPIDGSPGQLPRIRTEEVAATLINLPELEEQNHLVKEISQALEDIFRLSRAAQEELATINCFPASFFKQAFSGEI